MPVANIIDHRKRPYRFKKVTAVIEPTCHDNTVADSDRAVGYDDRRHLGYSEYPNTTVAIAVRVAMRLPYMATIYLYDLGYALGRRRTPKDAPCQTSTARTATSRSTKAKPAKAATKSVAVTSGRRRSRAPSPT